jgi:integrase
MPLSIRLRGATWHARGTVRVGTKTVTVREFSTGANTRTDAEAVCAAEEARIRADTLDGTAGRAQRLTVDDALVAYLKRPGRKLASYDKTRIAIFAEAMGATPLSEAAAAWREWTLTLRAGTSPATIARNRNIMLAALRYGCEVNGLPEPKLPSVKQSRHAKVTYLSHEERAALLRSYNPHAACPILLLAYQGMRSQEALQLDWRNVNLVTETIHVRADQSKTDRGRSMPMHPRVVRLLDGMWHAAGKPHRGPVFLSSRGTKWADTRGRGELTQGGNPLTSAHRTACAAAGIEGFRVHDWRHDWAARAVMAGVDLYTLMRVGGWSSLRMVERYASVSAEHARESMSRMPWLPTKSFIFQWFMV